MKIIKIMCIIVVLAIAVGGASIMLYRFVISPENMMVHKVNISDSYINLRGLPSGSAVQYKGHKAEYENGILYVTIYGGVFTFRKNGFDISIKNKYGDIEEIYLKGKPSSPTKLIWPKQ